MSHLPLNGPGVLAAVSSALSHGPTTNSAAGVLSGSPSLAQVARQAQTPNPHAVETIKTSAAAMLAQAMRDDEETLEPTSYWPYELSETQEEKPKRQRAVDPSQGSSSDFARVEDPLVKAMNKLVN